MTFCCSTLKSIIAKVLLHKSNDNNFELDAAHIPPVRSDEPPGSCDDGDGSGIFSNSIPASKRLDHIASWPDLKRRLSSRNTTSNSLNRAWLLKRIPNRSLFKSYQKTEEIVAALDFSYQHCIFEGLCNPGRRKGLGRTERQNAGSLLQLCPCPGCRRYSRLRSGVSTTSVSADQKQGYKFRQRARYHANLVKRVGR